MEESTDKPIPAFPNENHKVKKTLVILLIIVVVSVFLLILF